MTVLVDSCVIIDIITQDPCFSTWSEWALSQAVQSNQRIVINQIIYAEIASGFASSPSLQNFLKNLGISLENIPWTAAELAGKAYKTYRQNKGARTTTLPDFYIGAHAQVRHYTVLTRNPGEMRTYFTDIKLMTPETHPL